MSLRFVLPLLQFCVECDYVIVCEYVLLLKRPCIVFHGICVLCLLFQCEFRCSLHIFVCVCVCIYQN